MNVASVFPALGNQNYRRFWLTQWVALIGFWLQLTAQQWLVYKMTNSAILLGLLSACQFLPSMLFSLFIGYWIDRYNKRKLLIITQALYILQTSLLGLLLLAGYETYGWILFFAFFCGTIDAIDMPARLAFTPELVGPKLLHNAVSLNSANFNMTRMIGPLLAAFLLSFLPYYAVFFLNALSLLPLLYIYHRMNVNSNPPVSSHTSPLEEILAGLREVRRNTTVFAQLAALAVVSGLILNFGSYGPLFADRVLHSGLNGFGSILFFIGAGSMIGALFSATKDRHLRPAAIFRVALLIGVFLMLISHVSHFTTAMFLFAVIGFNVLLFIINCNTTVQLATPHEYLGRVMSIYTFVFLGVAPIGNLIVTSVIEWIGTSQGLLVIGLSEIILLLWIARKSGIRIW